MAETDEAVKSLRERLADAADCNWLLNRVTSAEYDRTLRLLAAALEARDLLSRPSAQEREKALEECRRAMCSGCRADMPMSDDGLWHDRDGYSMPCHAAAIRALKPDTPDR